MTALTSEGAVASQQFMKAAERLPVLWELAEEFNDLVALLEDPDADPAEIEAEMQRVAGDIKRKAHGVATVIGALEGLAGYQKANAERLVAKAKANQAHADRLRSYALACLQAIELDRLETGTHTFVVRQNPGRVEVVDAAAVPSEYQRTVITTTVDKKAIMDSYKQDGELVPGTEIVKSSRLEIR